MKKIVIIGPESTGKSTLSEQLAVHYNTIWCPEYAREFLGARGGNRYDYKDLLDIARGQIALEDRLLPPSRDLYIIDTNLYVMKVWCEVAFQNCHAWILREIAARKYDLYLLCQPDLPWTRDDLREYPDLAFRRRLFLMYKDLLVHDNTPWVEVSGSGQQRLGAAIRGMELIS